MKKVSAIFLILIVTVHNCKESADTFTPEPIAYLQLENSKLLISEVVTGLEIPWDIDASKPGELWFSEQKGLIHKLDLSTGEKVQALRITDLLFKKSYGLLGITLHPSEPFLFAHYTFQSNEDELQQEVKSRILKYDIKDDTLINPAIIIDNLPGNTYHNGSRLTISPDNKLIFSFGDVGNADRAKDDSFLGGKILRLNLDGSIPDDNPIKDSPIWSRSHRNVQGLVFADNGNLYATEHGPNNDDEVNLIQKNGTYGWPNVQGFCDEDWEKEFCSENKVIEPLQSWTPTIAIAGLTYYNHYSIPEWQNSLIAANMKGRAIRVLTVSDDGNSITGEQIYFQKHFGRIRDVSVAKNGDVYFSTSNQDWHPRFQPWMYEDLPTGPDRIIRISPIPEGSETITGLETLTRDVTAIDLLSENWNHPVVEEKYEAGANIYLKECMSCHGPEGKGSEDLIPPLAQSDWVNGDKGKLIRTLLLGLSGPIEVNGELYNQEMPAYFRLSDEEVADVLTYIKNSFENKSGAVIPGEVYVERQNLTNKKND